MCYVILDCIQSVLELAVIHWKITIQILSSFGTIAVLVFTIYQVYLLRNQVFGKIYSKAQVENVIFYLPEKRKHEVKGFEKAQKMRNETDIGKSVKIPTGKTVELHLKWIMKKKQHLRLVSIGSSGDYDKKPEILRLTRSFIKSGDPNWRSVKDWHGYWTTEYQSRYIPQDETVVASFEVIGRQIGKYNLQIRIWVEEAHHPHEEMLTVEVVEESEFDDYLLSIAENNRQILQ